MQCFGAYETDHNTILFFNFFVTLFDNFQGVQDPAKTRSQLGLRPGRGDRADRRRADTVRLW